MNTQALRNLLNSTRYNIAQIDADLDGMTVSESDGARMYHQGYQNGRKAELEKLATLLNVALAGVPVVDGAQHA